MSSTLIINFQTQEIRLWATKIDTYNIVSTLQVQKGTTDFHLLIFCKTSFSTHLLLLYYYVKTHYYEGKFSNNSML